MEGHLTLACGLRLSAGTPGALVGWASSILAVAFSLKKVPVAPGELVPVAPLLAELVPPHAPLPSPDQSLVQGQVTSQVGQPLGRHGQPAAPGVRLLMLASQRESS